MSRTISVCIPAYRGQFLAATIESILNQTRPVDEIIIVDDCSPDDLRAVVAQFNDPRIQYVRNAVNLGVPANYERALHMGMSEYVMLLGDHDLLEPAFMERCAALLDADPAVVLVFPAIVNIDEQGTVVRSYRTDLFPPVAPGWHLARWLVTHTASPITTDTLIRRSALAGLEPWFDPKYWWYGDIHLWIRLAVRGKVGYVAEPVLQRRVRERAHPLDHAEWRSMLACHSIRRDVWHLAFPQGGPLSWWWWLVYTARQDSDGLLLIASKLANTQQGQARVLPAEAMALFSPPGRVLARLLAWLPPWCARLLRRARRRFADHQHQQVVTQDRSL